MVDDRCSHYVIMDSGPNQLTRICNSVEYPLPDDMTVGFIFSNLLMFMMTLLCVLLYVLSCFTWT